MSFEYVYNYVFIGFA